jgi:hypothetical protein
MSVAREAMVFFAIAAAGENADAQFKETRTLARGIKITCWCGRL